MTTMAQRKEAQALTEAIQSALCMMRVHKAHGKIEEAGRYMDTAIRLHARRKALMKSFVEKSVTEE